MLDREDQVVVAVPSVRSASAVGTGDSHSHAVDRSSDQLVEQNAIVRRRECQAQRDVRLRRWGLIIWHGRLAVSAPQWSRLTVELEQATERPWYCRRVDQME